MPLIDAEPYSKRIIEVDKTLGPGVLESIYGATAGAGTIVSLDG